MTTATAMRAARTVGVALVCGVLAGGAALGQPSGSEGRTIEGTWYIRVQPIDCATGLAIPNVPPINSLATFHAGGTLSEVPGGQGFAPGQRTPGHGLWHHESGQTFSQKFTALINFTTVPGVLEAGWQTVTHTVSLLDRDHLESAGTNAFYRSDGTIYRTGCSTATGTRFE
jgi:hypothetical protein